MKLSNGTAKLTSIAQSIAQPTTLNTTTLRAIAAATLAAAVIAFAPAAHAQRFSVGVSIGHRYVAPAPVVVYNNGYYNNGYVDPYAYGYTAPVVVRGREDFRYDHQNYDRDRRDFDRNRNDRDHGHDFHR